MLSVLKAKSSQEINVSFELKKSQSFHWSGHAAISVQFCWTQDSISSQWKSQVDSQYM